MTRARPLRVLMTTDTVGGVWTYALELVTALRPLGVEVALATLGAPMSAAQARAAAALPDLELFESSFALEWMPTPWRDVDASGDWLLALAQLTRPDVVHVNGYSHAALPFRVPVVSVAHSCVCSWFRAVRGEDAGPAWREYRTRVTRGLRAATAVVAPTAAILRAIADALDVRLAGRVIPNGRAADRWAPGVKAPFVLAAGRLWDEAKGLADLAACADRSLWPIRVAGPLAAPAGVPPADPGGVDRLGDLPPDALAAQMAAASLFAHPARYEPFGLAVLEAALSGCALVLGDLETLREVWHDAAVYVPPGDPAQLAFALNTLVRDPIRRGVLASSARARARTLTPGRMAAGYRALYDEVAVARRQGVCA